MHVWHGRTYHAALSDTTFVLQAFEYERVRSMRDTRMSKFAEAGHQARRACQLDFDCNALSLGTRMLSRINLRRPTAASVQTAFVEAARKTKVGEPVTSPLLRAYLQVAISLPASSVGAQLARAWGMHAFYDAFITTTDRCWCATDADLLCLLSDEMEEVRAVRRTRIARAEQRHLSLHHAHRGSTNKRLGRALRSMSSMPQPRAIWLWLLECAWSVP